LRNPSVSFRGSKENSMIRSGSASSFRSKKGKIGNRKNSQ
jgi:hypothetical protein